MTDTVALLNGQAGIDVANTVFANVAGPDRFADGVGLIETAAADGAVSPVHAERPDLCRRHRQSGQP